MGLFCVLAELFSVYLVGNMNEFESKMFLICNRNKYISQFNTAWMKEDA